MSSITLNGQEITIKPPSSPSLAMTLVRLSQSSPELAAGAALALSAPGLAKTRGVVVNRADLAATGQAMYDAIVARLRELGVGGTEALRQTDAAASTALSAMLDALPFESEVQEDVGNSEPTPLSS